MMTRARCMAYALTVFALGVLLSYAGVPTFCIKKHFCETTLHTAILTTQQTMHHRARSHSLAPQSLRSSLSA